MIRSPDVRPVSSRSVRLPPLTLVLLAGAGLLPAVADEAAQPPRDRITRLVDQIATGSEDESAEAAAALLDQMTEPLAAALSDLDQRPHAERQRIAVALQRVTAVLRMRVHRALLPEADHARFDRMLRLNRPLVEQLFHDDPGRRRAALRQVPLEPDSPAGVLISAKFHDWDAEVVEAAFAAARELNDEIVTRGAVRFIAEATEAVRGGAYGPAEQAMVIVLTDFVRQAIGVVGPVRDADHVATVLAAIECFDAPARQRIFRVADALVALGQPGNTAAVPLLTDYLDDDRRHTVRALGPGVLLEQQVGDAALLALLRIYGLDPETFGFVSAADGSGLHGFTEAAQRQQARRRYAEWSSTRQDAPPTDQRPATTQPAAGGER